jgi:acyl-CoA dehydrogenase
MNDELVLLQEQVSRFLNREFVPHAQAWERQRQVAREAWLKAAEAGLLCASVPEEYGGGGGTRAHEAVILQQVTWAGLGGGFGGGNIVSSGIVAHYILAYGTEAQKRRWLPAMASGRIIGAIAMTEPGAGSDLQNIRTRGVAVAGGYKLSGQKTFISNGQTADLIIVVARTEDRPGAGGISLLAVEAENANGFRRGKTLEKIGLHAQDTS